MTAAKKTLRLIFPDWQHGANPSAGFVPRLIATIAPQGARAETAEVPEPEFVNDQAHVDLMAAQAAIARPEEDFKGFYETTLKVLEEKDPEHVISFATDGAVTLCTADYLHRKYPDLGVLWIDAHREHVTPERFWKKRVIIAGAVTGNQEFLDGIVKNPIEKSRFFFISRDPEEIPPADRAQFEHLGIVLGDRSVVQPESTRIHDWIRESGVKQLIVHFDLDSVGAADLRSGIYREEAWQEVSDKPESLVPALRRIFATVRKEVEVVGFDLMEYELLQTTDFVELMKDCPIFAE